MTELIQINSYGKNDIKGKLPRIFEMKKIYHQFKTMKEAQLHIRVYPIRQR